MKNVYIFIAIEAKTPDKELKAKLIKEHFIESPFKIFFTFHKLQPGEIAGILIITMTIITTIIIIRCMFQ